MKSCLNKYNVFFCVCFSCLLFSPAFSASAPTEKKVADLLYLIKKHHYSAPEFNKAFAQRVIQNYLYAIDGQCIFLYKKDIAAIEEIINSENTEQGLCKSYRYIQQIFSMRQAEADSLLEITKTKKYVWNKTDTLFYNNTYKNKYASDIKQKSDKIDEWLKLYVLYQLELAGKLETQWAFQKNDTLFLKAVKGLQKNFAKKRANYMDTERYLLQAIAMACDPHTEYFTPQTKNKFTRGLSSKLESFGFDIIENEAGQIEVESIVPGSYAWKCNCINDGDRVKEIKFKNKALIDVSTISIEELEEMLDNPAEKEMEITLVKKNGKTVKTDLQKSTIVSTDNLLNSYVLSPDNPIGYIPLPSFYTNFYDNKSTGCSNDIAKEIVKLKKENIKGLILDLRFNGGGSLNEAVDIAGIFIDVAPLCLLKQQAAKPILVKDFNRGSIYDGPIVILINKASASASEVLAQMLKTQHRAIILGDNSYGKATAQTIIPLDTSYSFSQANKKYDEKNGYLKITIEKIYTLDGTTHQIKGVAPHVIAPDFWSKLPFGEGDYDNALSNDVLNKKIPVTALPDNKLETCVQKSNERIRNNSHFKAISLMADTIRDAYNRSYALPLNPQGYYALIAESEMLEESAFFSEKYADTTFAIIPNKQNEMVIQMDTYLSEIIQEQVLDLQKDVILREAYNILIDYNTNQH